MAYTKQNFVDGEILTHTKLNAMDDQIALNESGKVDKVTGKGLSTNDYDDVEKLNLKVTSEALQAEIKKMKNIIELNKGVTYTETDDTTTAMTKIVPANAQSYAEVRKIGGKTQVVSGELKSAAVTAVKSYYGSTLLETKSIPAAVQALPGYGWSAGTVCNEIDWVNRKYIQRVAGVDLGTLYWDRSEGDGKVQFGTTGISSTVKSVADNSVVANILCPLYETKSENAAWGANSGIAITNSSRLDVYDAAYSTAEAFKAAMDGVMVYYELATPIETDISGILTADYMIMVVANKNIVFENANNMTMPSTVSYMVKAGE